MVASTLFLLYPQNEPFVTGSSRFPARLPATKLGCAAALLSIMFLVGLVFFAVSLLELRGHLLLAQNSEEVTGWVVRRDYVYDDGDQYAILYQFVVNDITYKHKQAVDRTLYDSYQAEQPITIEYAANNPDVSRIAGTNDIYLIAFLAVFSTVWTLIIGVIAASSLTKTRQMWRLRRGGQLVTGTFHHIQGRRGSDDDFLVEITVAFVPPDTGQPYTGKREYTCNHLAKTPLPEGGVRAAILYLNIDIWEVL